MIDPNKYVVFKREEYDKRIANGLTPLHEMELQDAVVIRRQDRFAGPALHVYAANIGLVAAVVKPADPIMSEELSAVADYFHQQALLADAEGFKFPD